jgi:REP element-mobilizing transposase RayT
MPRPERPLLAGGLYHVTARGNNKQALFRDDSDKSFFLALLRQARERFGCRFLAYSVMTNHYHLAIETPEANLDRIMAFVNFSYSRNYARRYATVGHVFGGRYTSKIVDKDAYLTTLIRYIHLNPVKAGMAPEPAAYPWSSHPYYAGAKSDSLVDPSLGLAMFSQDPAAAPRRYLSFLYQPVPARQWKRLDNGRNGRLLPRRASVDAADQTGTFRTGEAEKVPATF